MEPCTVHGWLTKAVQAERRACLRVRVARDLFFCTVACDRPQPSPRAVTCEFTCATHSNVRGVLRCWLHSAVFLDPSCPCTVVRPREPAHSRRRLGCA